MANELDRPAFFRTQMVETLRVAEIRLFAAREGVMTARGKMRKIEARRERRVTAGIVALAKQMLAREDAGEKAAPSVQRQDIKRGEVMLRDARVVMVGKRPELQSALERLLARNVISQRLYRAGRRYREAWEMAGRDTYPNGTGGEGGSGGAKSGNRRIEDAVAKSVALSAARIALGTFGTAMLDHVVIEGLTLASWAERKGMSEHSGSGMLITTLERLDEHWKESDLALAAANGSDAAPGRIRSIHGRP